MGFLSGKKALILGVVSNRSIAWGAAVALHREGAELAFTTVNERFMDRITKLANQLDSNITLPCDVTKDEEINGVMAFLKERWGRIDIIIHSVAFAPAGQLDGDFLDDVTREGFAIANDVSAYSFVALAKAARSYGLLQPGSALLTMSYLGAVRAVPHYNAMGPAKASLEASVSYLAASRLGQEQVRVNAISAGPIKTLAAKGIADFNKLLEYGEKNSPLRRNVTIEEVGNTAAFLCSDLASGITGEVVYVDSGYHVQAMSVPEEVS
ncbi:MAG: enoyl-ACP reductase [Gammaproteobacteria bacterium]|nr:enoyl-ACP reductase [Gammaproteobacteria bacterium]